jgi:hypothetical protein
MFKCTECGHIFEDGEQKTYAEHHPYGSTTADEYFSVCPVCGGEYEEAKTCKCCGGAFLEEELIGGYYCDECLKNAFDLDSFLDFATSGTDKPTEVDTLEDFVFTMIFGLKEAPNESGYSLKAWCKIVYNEAKRHGDILMKTIFEYMDKTPSMWEYFAEYLHEKESVKEENPPRCSHDWCERWEPEGCQLAYNCEDFEWTHDKEVKE